MRHSVPLPKGRGLRAAEIQRFHEAFVRRWATTVLFAVFLSFMLGYVVGRYV
jgi:hypothetical protein